MSKIWDLLLSMKSGCVGDMLNVKQVMKHISSIVVSRKCQGRWKVDRCFRIYLLQLLPQVFTFTPICYIVTLLSHYSVHPVDMAICVQSFTINHFTSSIITMSKPAYFAIAEYSPPKSAIIFAHCLLEYFMWVSMCSIVKLTLTLSHRYYCQAQDIVRSATDAVLETLKTGDIESFRCKSIEELICAISSKQFSRLFNLSICQRDLPTTWLKTIPGAQGHRD